MTSISVDMGRCRYSIHIGQNILGDVGRLLNDENNGNKFIIITSPNINRLYGQKLIDGLDSESLEHGMIIVPDGEKSKSLKEAESLYCKLLEFNADRDSCIIALGGGVIGDLAGFVAATYMRGIPIVHIPTTLLAQVDSSIGGKTGVDLPSGKNLVGAFHQPKMVFSDIDTLKTLPEKDIISGLGEIIKYAIISDPELFGILEENISTIIEGDMEILTEVITKCSRIKAEVVEEDERDNGKRMILNLGHTLGHAVETITNYDRYGHGEAVAIGTVFAAKVAVNRGILDIAECDRILNLIEFAGLPTSINEISETEKLLEIMQRDKKTKDGRIRLVLPKKIGEVFITGDVPLEVMKKVIEEMSI